MKVLFSKVGKKQFNKLRKIEQKKVTDLVKKIIENKAPFKKMKGKKYEGCLSSRINLKDRLLYKIDRDKGKLIIILCNGHYDDN